MITAAPLQCSSASCSSSEVTSDRRLKANTTNISSAHLASATGNSSKSSYGSLISSTSRSIADSSFATSSHKYSSLSSSSSGIVPRIDTYESTVVTIDVDPSIVPAIIGKGGETIKALEKTGVGATLEVEKGSSKVSVQSIDSATRLAVLEKIKEIVENNQTERLPINKNIIGLLLGEPGKDIRKAITDEMGAWMSLDDDESCIIIRGNKDKV